MKPLYWLSLVILLLFSACAGPASVEPVVDSEIAATAVPAESGAAAVEYTNKEADFSISLPDEWITAEASPNAFAEMRSAVGAAFLTDAYVQALLASGLQLYALNENAASLNSDVPVSMKIIRRDAPTSLSLAEYVADTANQLGDILELTSSLEQSTVMLGDDEAVQLRYSLQMQTAAGTKAEVHNTQYYVINGDDLYIITLEMGQELVADYLATAETAVETFTASGG